MILHIAQVALLLRVRLWCGGDERGDHLGQRPDGPLKANDLPGELIDALGRPVARVLV